MKVNFNLYFTFFLLGAAVLAWTAVFYSLPDGRLKFYALDVGQGDAIFIETPRKAQVLIDGGPDMKVLAQLSAVMPFYDRSIDLIIITHPQEDHMFGLAEVLKRYKVGRVLTTGVNYSSRTYQEFKRVIKDKNIPVVIARAGQRVNLGGDGVIDILYPNENLSSVDFLGDVNDSSIAALLRFGEKRFLTMGDAGIKEELDIINSGQADIDVLKISHHGSRFSTSALFLEKTTPEIALVSAGAHNPYGHPHGDTLERLGNIPVYRTDTQGRIAVITDGENLTVKTER
ncbi:MAG TPA: ComEC/Rec2 family competence protein [Candidatus Paceibacterota bacterium]